MQGSIYNDRVDQAKEMAKMAVTLFEGKDLDQESLKDGRYYFSEYKKVDGSNKQEYLNAEEEEADRKNSDPAELERDRSGKTAADLYCACRRGRSLGGRIQKPALDSPIRKIQTTEG